VYSSVVAEALLLVLPPASSTLPFGSKNVWPPLMPPRVAASRDQVLVAAS
jgi:hypothetical protein